MALNDVQLGQIKELLQKVKSGGYGTESKLSMVKICADLRVIDKSFESISLSDYAVYSSLNIMLLRLSNGDIKEKQEEIPHLLNILKVPKDKHHEFKDLIMSPVQRTSGASLSSSSSSNNNAASVSAVSNGPDMEKVKQIFLDARKGVFLNSEKDSIEGAKNFVSRLREAGVALNKEIPVIKLADVQTSLNFVAGKKDNPDGLAVVNLRAALRHVIRDENTVNLLLKDAKGWMNEVSSEERKNENKISFASQYQDKGHNNIEK